MKPVFATALDVAVFVIAITLSITPALAAANVNANATTAAQTAKPSSSWPHRIYAKITKKISSLNLLKTSPKDIRNITLPPITLKLPTKAENKRPQGLILITIDTLRADFLHAYGHQQMITPNLDKLASMGTLFRRAIAQSTTTTPSHASLLTSLYLQDHNVYSNFERLGEQATTLPEMFAQKGFRTFAIVNMPHLNGEISGLDQGFETYLSGSRPRQAQETFDEAIAWLQKNPQDPFFAWIHLRDVHTPYAPPAPYNTLYYPGDPSDPAKDSLAKIWPTLPEHISSHPFFQSWLSGIRDLEWVKAQYQGAITYVDDEIGRLMRYLQKENRLTNTAIVVTADHGESLGEHRMHFVHTGLYEPTVRVPLIAHIPNTTLPGSEITDVVEHVDLLPTLAEVFDLPMQQAIRGQSLVAALKGGMSQERWAFSEHAGRNLVGLRSNRFKYVRHLRDLAIQPEYPFVQGKEELYDLLRDPYEHNNLVGKAPKILAMCRKKLAERQQAKLELKAGQAQIDTQAQEALRALGYVR